MPTNNIIFNRPFLYPKQKAAIYEPKRFSLIEASTKAGKTVSCIIWLIEQALTGRDGWNYWWVAPVSGQSAIAFTRMRRALENSGNAFLAPMRIVLPNGSIIWFKSADKPDSLYGEDVHALVIDEASRVKEGAWYALRSVITATLGRARIIGNVHGRKNWFYRMSRLAEQGHPEMGFHRITAYDAISAGVLAKEEIESARAPGSGMPEHVFKELYLAEAADDGGNPFGLQAIKACTIPQMLFGRPAVWGWDLAKSVDWTVGIALTWEGAVCRFERWQHVPWPETKDRIMRTTARVRALVDSTGLGDPVVQDLQRASGRDPESDGQQFEGYQFTPRSKQQLMEGLAGSIQSQHLTFPAGPIVDELEQFEYQMTGEEGRFTGVKYSAPPGFHDDCVMALALADMHRKRVRRPMAITPAVLQALDTPPRFGTGLW
jgi:hypothetical protein